MEAGYIVRWLPGQGLPHALHTTRHRGRDTRAGGGDPRRAERLMPKAASVERVAIIGLGLIGSSISAPSRRGGPT